jgi:hypothetical protein
VYLWFSAQQPVSDSGGHLDGAGRRLLTLPPIPDAQRPYPEGTAAGQPPLVVGGTVNPADTHSISGETLIFYLTFLKTLVANATFFFFCFHRLVLRRVNFILYIVFCLGVAWWCGRELVWKLACFGSALTWLWLGLKSAGELCHSPLGIDSADNSQQPNGEICIDKSHILKLLQVIFSWNRLYCKCVLKPTTVTRVRYFKSSMIDEQQVYRIFFSSINLMNQYVNVTYSLFSLDID